MKKILYAIVAVLLLSTVVFAQEKTVKLKVGASPVPHAEILNLVKDDLKQEGILLEVIVFTDYVTPNIALNDKQIDANFFQHLPYLESFAQDRKMNLISLAGIHIEPLGLYSNKFKSLEDIKEKAQIAIPNDPTNEGRALLLLQSKGLIKLKPESGLKANVKDIIENPKKLKFVEIEAAQLPRILRDVDFAVINGNYAIGAKLNPVKDAIILEGAESPYVNIIAIRAGSENDAALKSLVKALKTEKVKKFMIDNYNGGVVPVF